jgi:hypothetical protein
LQRILCLLLCVSGTAFGAQTSSDRQGLAAQISAAESRVTITRPRTVAEAEAEGAAYPRATPVSPSDPARTCTTIRPDQIVFPTTHGDLAPYRLWSGEFYASAISFGWGDTYEHAKMPLQPARPDAIGAGLWIRAIRLDQPAEGTTFAASELVRPSTGGPRFFAGWPIFPTPGKWMLIATAGANWGCFVLDRPVK